MAQVLRPIQEHPASRHPDLVVGTETGDDAGVYRLAPETGLVQTVDFFTPVVDDAYDWGRIAASNALSDVYAMGGRPLTALQLLAWPRDELPFSLASEVVKGGSDVMALAECTILGGHSIDDSEPKYGFAVTGLVDPGSVLRNVGGRPGDALVLTKPIGTGIIATAIKKGDCPDGVRRAAIDVMVALNAHAGAVAAAVAASAATDVTGFGLLGHLSEMLAHDLGARIDVDLVPVIEGTWELLDAGIYPGGSERNLEAVRHRLDGGDERSHRLLADAQTSGGLLIAVAQERVADLLDGLGQAAAGSVIGELTGDSTGRIVLS